MKNFYRISVLLLLVGVSEVSSAQLEIRRGPGRTPILFTQSDNTVEVENTGATTSPNYRVRVWASIDGNFDADPIFEQNYDPLVAGQINTVVYNRPTPILTDNRPLADIVDSPYFYRSCVDTFSTELVCINQEILVYPADASVPIASLGTSQQGVELEYQVETRNGEVPFEFLLIGWRDRALDGGPTQAESFIEVSLNDLNLLDDGQISKRYGYLFESTPGVPGSFSIRQCYASTNFDDSRICSFSGTVTNTIGYRTAVPNVTQGELNDRVRVEWPRFAFAQGFDAYQVTRCRDDMTGDCVVNRVPSIGAVERFDDMSPVRGERYIYTIDACIGFGITSCDPDTYTNIGVSGLGFVGLVDEFEEDDTAAQATLVSKNVTQLHSFDSSSDDDWLKLLLDKPGRIAIETLPFAGESVDTVITLYDAQEAFIDSNDDADPENAPGSFSKLETEMLPAGEYFVKVEHYELPGGEFPAPMANNYLIRIEFLDAAINIAPIIQLLLLDED